MAESHTTTSQGRDSPSAADHRAGFVALLGPPNSGKSALLNRLLGEKIAIVSAKPQTTRSRVLGICNRPSAQILFLDTPGLHRGTKPLNMALNECVHEAAENCDLALLLVDLSQGWQEVHEEIYSVLRSRHAPVILVGSKDDLPERRDSPWPPGAASGETALRISAEKGHGLEALMEAIAPHLPISPPLYPRDALTDRPVRWLAGELVREAAYEELAQELPYTVAVEVVEFDESRPELVRIRANLLVSRSSQKRIVVGRAGEVIKRIGSRARPGIEELVNSRVYLDLWVKVDPDWLRNRKRIKELGYF